MRSSYALNLKDKLITLPKMCNIYEAVTSLVEETDFSNRGLLSFSIHFKQNSDTSSKSDIKR